VAFPTNWHSLFVAKRKGNEEAEMSETVFFNAPGSAKELEVTTERARQLFKAKKIPTVAWLNGRYPLTDYSSLMTVKRQREARKRRAA
jgi:hypothetical protein